MNKNIMLFMLFIISIPMAKTGKKPGTFFWRPRLALDLTVPTTEYRKSTRMSVPTVENMRAGLVVFIYGYEAGMTVISLAAGLSSGYGQEKHLNPTSAYFYTNVYRWTLRYISLIPFWMSGQGKDFCDTTKVWRKRFYYVDQFMPKWMRYLFPYVKQEEWDQEEKEYKRFRKYAESAFGKHFRHPNKHFNNFKSQETQETVEDMEKSSGLDDK